MDQPHPPPQAPLWIPPGGLGAAQFSHGASWILLAVLASQDLLGFSLQGLAWVHLVALGWLTMASLSVLIHVIPGFLGAKWRGEGWARRLLLPFAIGTAGMVLSFWFAQPAWLAGFASLVVVALAGYLAAAGVTVWHAPTDASRSVRRAFLLVLTLLGVTATLGVAMAWALNGYGHPWWLIQAPSLHAHTGVLGWLSLLVIGVSTRTVRPITGGPSPYPWLHAATGGLVGGGLPLLLIGLATSFGPVLAVGALCCGLATLGYAVDMGLILKRARVRHRPPQAFLGIAALYFLATAGLGAGVLLGYNWQSAYVFLALMGWLGQMTNGHLHHIGIRVLATWVRGEDDETPPGQLLTAKLSWSSFVLFQFAVIGTTAGLLGGQSTIVFAAALTGFAAWAVMGANVFSAWKKARIGVSA